LQGDPVRVVVDEHKAAGGGDVAIHLIVGGEVREVRYWIPPPETQTVVSLLHPDGRMNAVVSPIWA
jgi:hypothetical protein